MEAKRDPKTEFNIEYVLKCSDLFVVQFTFFD